MKYLYRSLFLLLGCIASLSYAQAPNLEAMDIVTKSIPDGPVARVGKVNVEKIDFILLYRSELNRFAQNKPGTTLSDEDRVRIAQFCVNILVEQELLHQDALSNKVTVSQADVKKQADAQYKRLQKGFSNTAGREVTEKEILERLGYTDRSEINEELERGMLIATMRKHIIEEHAKSIPDASIQEMYEKNKAQFNVPDQVHLRQIFLKAGTADKELREAAKKKADTALARIFSGQRFETVAKETSQASDAKKGGDMGLIPTNQTLPVMNDALKSMEIDDVSDVLESEFGYHIIQLVARKKATSVPQKEAYAIIRDTLAKQQGLMVVRQYCDRLIDEDTEVNVFLELNKNLKHITGKKIVAPE